MQQLYSSSQHWQAENKVILPSHLPISFQSSPPLILPELAGSPRVLSYRAQYLQPWELERQFLSDRCTLWLIPVKVWDTEVKQLKLGSHHYWKENKTTNSPATSPRPPHPHPSLLISVGTWETSGNEARCIAPRAAAGLNKLELYCPSHSPTGVVLWERGDLVTEEMPPQGTQGIFYHPEELEKLE